MRGGAPSTKQEPPQSRRFFFQSIVKQNSDVIAVIFTSTCGWRCPAFVITLAPLVFHNVDLRALHRRTTSAVTVAPQPPGSYFGVPSPPTSAPIECDVFSSGLFSDPDENVSAGDFV